MAIIEKNTNQALRKKYFEDAQQIVTTHKGSRTKKIATSTVFRAPNVKSKGSVRLLKPGTAPGDDIIKVQVHRENDIVKSIHIKCPCGRTAELNCEYSPEL